MTMSLLAAPNSNANVSQLTQVWKQRLLHKEHCCPPRTISIKSHLGFHLNNHGSHLLSRHIVACISSSSSSSNPTTSTRLYISGLSFRTTEESLKNAFVEFGQLVEVNLVMDRIANRPRGFAFISYATEDESMKAIQGMHGKDYVGRKKAKMEDKYRSFIYGEDEKNTTWIHGGSPNFDVVNKLFGQGRTQEWPLGSLEEKVQRLVKTMEMELFHKANPKDYKGIDPSRYTFAVNGRKALTLPEKRKLGGGYNGFIQTSLPEVMRVYDPAKETMESSHELFTTTFPRGFALEILQVYSGPPVITYKFRHWGYMEGPFKGYPPTGELIELFGVAIFEVDDQMKIVKVEFFFDRGELLGPLMKGGRDVSCPSDSMTAGCPFLGNVGPKD